MGDDAAFVGRANELDALLHWLAEASGGKPRTVTLEGEAGVGKSRLLDAFLERTGPDVLVLRGRCHEDASVPYLPLATALGDLVPQWSVAPRGSSSPEQRTGDDRLRLFLDVTRALTESCLTRPVVLAVDDIHWSDRATTELLTHALTSVAMDESRAPKLLALLLHRPAVEDPVLARALDRLRRDPSARQLALGGLDEAAVNALVSAAMGLPPSRPLARDLTESSGGNPYLVLSLLRRLDSFGGLAHRSGKLVRTSEGELHGLPARLDTLLGERIEGLPVSTQRVLTTVSFLGDDVDNADVEVVTGLAAADLASHAETAVAAGLLVDDGGHWRFAHPQVRQILFHRPGGRRRREIHAQIASRLEQARPDDNDALLTIAHHLQRAGAEVDGDRLARIGLAAAGQAAAIGAWSDARTLYEAMLDATAPDAEGPSGFRGVLHHRAALACWWDHDNAASLDHSRRAIQIARALGDLERWGLAAVISARAAFPASQGSDPIDLEPLLSFLDAAGDAVPEIRAQVLGELARAHVDRGDLSTALDEADAAQKLASATGDEALIRSIDIAAGFARLASLDLRGAETDYRRSAQRSVSDRDPLPSVWARNQLALTLWIGGRIDEAVDVVVDAGELARRIGAWSELVRSLCWRAGIEAWRGDHETSERWASEAVTRARWVDEPALAFSAWPALAAARAGRGDVDGAMAALDEMHAQIGRGTHSYRLLALVRAGAVNRATTLARERPLTAVALGRQLTLYTVGIAATNVALAVALEQPALAEPVLDPLRDAMARGVVHVPDWPLDLPSLVPAAAALVAQPPPAGAAH